MAHVNCVGPKMIGKDRDHTVIKAARALLWRMQQWDEVRRVDTGLIQNVGHSRKKLKIWPERVGLRVKVCGTENEQVFFVYTRKPEKVEGLLRAAFGQE